MACRDDCVGKKAKPRFKGIENFLRRVAFNLGNSPSQTEVKIISCIPIDVTDLQQKIIHLEKQLEEVKGLRKTSAPRASTASALTPGKGVSSSNGNLETVVNTAQVRGHFTAALPSGSLSQTKSAVSYETQPEYQQKLPPLRTPTRINEVRRHQLSKKNRKLKRHTPLIYYAQTVTSPFNYNRKESDKKEKQKAEAAVDLSYFTDIIHKQYMPEMYADEVLGSSEVSAPVCRDGAAPVPVHECDVCSCCRGYFHDVDRDRQPYSFLDTSTTSNPNIDSGNVYYNSSLYDLIPVKDKPEINKKEIEKSTKREPKFQCEAKCWPGNFRSKPLCRPVMVNYAYTLPPQRYVKHRPVKSPKRRERCNRGIFHRNDVSRNTSVECGNIYTKQYLTGKYNPPQNIKPQITKRSVQCLTRSVNDTECQTETGRYPQHSSNTTTEENKTESTLNQIKTILQSVLSHVKTNTLAKNQSEEKGKKEDDTLLHGSVAPECSRLLNSFTYSPFSIDSYIASCSRGLPTLCPIGPISSSQAKGFPTVIPSPHFKCMQNFPVFIQQGHPRHHCTSCNRATGPTGHPKQTSTNTLTRAEEKRNIETENLIKEIYKSIALNMSSPQKLISRTNYNYLKSSEISRNQLGEPVVSNVMTYNPKVGPSDRSLKGQMIQTLMSTATASIATSSTRTSQPGRTPDDQRSLRYHSSALRGTQLGPKSVNNSTTTTTTMTHRKSRIIEENEPFSDNSENETASDNTIVSASNRKSFKETEKVGIFSKLFGSVFKKRRRKSNRKEMSTSAVESESDSDDYETIYSQKVESPARPKRVTYAASPHHSRKSSLVWRKRFERPRHTKYMDPENRRYWDEQLGYHTTPPPAPAPRPPTARGPPSILRTPPPARAQPPRRAPTPRRGPARPAAHGITLRTRGKRYQPMDSWYASLDSPHPPFELKNEVEYAPAVPYRESKPRPPRLSVGLRGSNKKLSGLKRHNLGLHCGEQCKKTLLEG